MYAMDFADTFLSINLLIDFSNFIVENFILSLDAIDCTSLLVACDFSFI